MNKNRIITLSISLTIFLLSSIALHSQEQANASKWNAGGRFGVGVGYNVLNLLKQDGMFFQRYKLHPLEIDFRYRLDNHNH